MGLLRWASGLYLKGQAWDKAFTVSRSLGRPVISVGNIASGGRGKTPFVIYIAQGLFERGFFPVVLTRGYGRKSLLPAWLEKGASFSVDDSGDEALEIFLKTGSPVLVSSKRYSNALRWLKSHSAIEKQMGRKIVFILDDGFQHWKIRRNFDLVLTDVLDYVDGVIPDGQLREPVEALQRAHLVLKRGEDFEKRSEMKVAPQKSDSILLLTTRAPDLKYQDDFKLKFPKVKEIRLKDHADRGQILKTLMVQKDGIVCLGAKEAAKLLSVEDLSKLMIQGHFAIEMAGHKWDLRYVDCRLEIFQEQKFWDKIQEKLG